MRASGILLPITSLPSPYGIGTFGKSAYSFVDKLKAAKQTYWQVLPLVGTSYGDSPYQSFSTFAGNPYFIDFDMLVDEGLLKKSECESYNWGTDPQKVDYEKIYQSRYVVLKLAFERSHHKTEQAYKDFLAENEYWLPDYSLFMAIKDFFLGDSYCKWSDPIRLREQRELDKYRKLLVPDIELYNFIQYKFFEQWGKLKSYANKNGIKIIGDLPIYVALDSADTWSMPELFEFDSESNPKRVAGCPPDDYAKTGQLWGNPLYDWDYNKKTNYDWWVKRIDAATRMYDTVRIDHFRGFSEYYAIPATDDTAQNGIWVEGPGIELFKTIRQKLGKRSIIAEDLGFMTPSVKKMLKESGYPGMKVLQFGLYSGSDSDYLPYKYERNTVCYTGTHDNPTTVGWLKSIKPRDRKFIREFTNKNGRITAFDIIVIGMASVSDLMVVPLQDYLELPDTARMNIPSTIGGNWEWRMGEDDFGDDLAEKIGALTTRYGRVVRKKK